MDLKVLKNLCYASASATSSAQYNEKMMKIEFIKEFLFSHLRDGRTKEIEGGISCLDVEDKYIYVGQHYQNLARILSLNYDPKEEGRSSMCGITAYGYLKSTDYTINLAIENLPYPDINSIFIALSSGIN